MIWIHLYRREKHHLVLEIEVNFLKGRKEFLKGENTKKLQISRIKETKIKVIALLLIDKISYLVIFKKAFKTLLLLSMTEIQIKKKQKDLIGWDHKPLIHQTVSNNFIKIFCLISINKKEKKFYLDQVNIKQLMK